jgi:hypothetical protein
MVYVRVAIYFLAPLLGMLPGITYDAAAQVITIDLQTALIGLSGAGLVTGGIFAKWGIKR